MSPGEEVGCEDAEGGDEKQELSRPMDTAASGYRGSLSSHGKDIDILLPIFLPERYFLL